MMIYQSGFVQWNALLPSLLSRHLHYLGVPNIPCVLSGHFYDSRVQRIGCGRHKGRAPRDKGLQEEFQTDGQTNKAGASRWQERDANRVFLQDHCALVRAARQNKRRQCCQTNVFVNLYTNTHFAFQTNSIGNLDKYANMIFLPDHCFPACRVGLWNKRCLSNQTLGVGKTQVVRRCDDKHQLPVGCSRFETLFLHLYILSHSWEIMENVSTLIRGGYRWLSRASLHPGPDPPPPCSVWALMQNFFHEESQFS